MNGENPVKVVLEKYLSTTDGIEREFQCSHPRRCTVKFQFRDGRVQLVEQCLDCGEKASGWLKQAGWNLDELGWFDQELFDNYRAERRKRFDEARHRYLEESERQQMSEQQKFWANYNRYLQTPQWSELRRKVLTRDDSRCQNCFRRVNEFSAHIHHLSYVGFKRVGKSFAFECVTLCASCHTEVHPHMGAE